MQELRVDKDKANLEIGTGEVVKVLETLGPKPKQVVLNPNRSVPQAQAPCRAPLGR